ncbi:hypothetical protein [Chryseobacterium lathyri]|nr:hypothetical protein [Chryseobacterium lathyri]MDQ0066511.1 hypothetical protein [Chryseobacterium lathyri]
MDLLCSKIWYYRVTYTVKIYPKLDPVLIGIPFKYDKNGWNMIEKYV